jgi:hypothetical protein
MTKINRIPDAFVSLTILPPPSPPSIIFKPFR